MVGSLSDQKSTPLCTQRAVEKAFVFAEEETTLAKVDASHDWNHVLRVRKNALDIAEHMEMSGDRKRLVEFISLLHDLPDSKYAGHAERATRLEAFLEEQVAQADLGADSKDLVTFVLARMSFKDESKGSCKGIELPVELKIVQDGDRLDAIGAIGIARCFCFGGSRKSKIVEWQETPEPGLTNDEGIVFKTCVGHFYEKLLKLKNLMKTERGREIAEGRHKVMLEFLHNIENECRVK